MTEVTRKLRITNRLFITGENNTEGWGLQRLVISISSMKKKTQAICCRTQPAQENVAGRRTMGNDKAVLTNPLNHSSIRLYFEAISGIKHKVKRPVSITGAGQN
jgi:hypothetical protein